MAGGRVKVCGMAIPGGGITGATVATVGGAIIVAGAMVGRTTPGSPTIIEIIKNIILPSLVSLIFFIKMSTQIL